MADDQAAKDAAAKSRIIKHMNGDHQLEIQRYLQHYAKLPVRKASQNPQIVDITLDTVTISTRDGTNHTIPWVPPLKSWADARISAVNMDREARGALGISDIRVNEYVTPTLFHFIVGVFTTAEYFALAAYVLGLDKPGTLAYGLLAQWFPGGADLYRWIQSIVLIPVVFIHVGEAVWMDRKVRSYGIERGSKLWWLWVGDNALEGYGAHYRLDELVKKKEVEKALKKH